MWRLIRYDIPLHLVLFLTNWLPDNVVFIKMRGALVRPFFKKCGRNLGVGRNVTFYNPSKIELGNSVYIAYGCWFLGAGNLVIGDEVMFGPYVVVSPSNHTKLGLSYRFGAPVEGNIEIGNGSWIGAHSTIVLGGNMGAGCMLAANAVLTSSAEDNTVYGGVPAKIIKKGV